MRGTATIFSSASTEWATPQETFEALDREFHFTLDVCATADNAKCEQFYTKEDNGLTKNWRGRVFMNPPYGKDMAQWMRKAYESSLEGALVVCLIHARTDTRWFHDHVYGKAELRFLKGRLVFACAEDDARSRSCSTCGHPRSLHRHGAPFPSMVAIYRPAEISRAREVQPQPQASQFVSSDGCY